MARHAFGFGTRPPSRVQRLSATRAAHRVIRRSREMDEKHSLLRREAQRRVRAALGREDDADAAEHAEYRKLLEADPQWHKAKRLWQAVWRIGLKCRFSAR